MPNYILAYHGGGQPETPEEGAKHMERWRTWLSDLGDAVVNPGTPLGKSTFVNAGGVMTEGGSEALTGFGVVSADNMEAALEMAKACPFVEIGTLEVAEMKEL